MATLYLHIYNPSNNRVLYKDKVKAKPNLHADTFAKEYAAMINRQIIPSETNDGDFRVEFRLWRDKPAWFKARSYYFKPQG
jgi:hypothetical protein